MKVLFAASLLLLAGCGPPPKSRPAAELGSELFDSPALSTDASNRFSCGTCHSRTADEGTRRLAGFPLANSAQRGRWWSGSYSQYLDAVNYCVVFFMRGARLKPGQPNADALYEFLVSISPAPKAEPIYFTIERNIRAPAAGSAAAGEKIYEIACRSCHGARGTSAGLLQPSTPLDSSLSTYYTTTYPTSEHGVLVTGKVRLGNFFGFGGSMPPFALERLSEAELADLIAFLAL